ncbi:MAG: FixH family protein [Bacteroidia bacterium]|nr:FixH family protein [Bacteroidia bacterium]MCZ2140642.1 FixH family protein [Bacteroidia bacterium]
MKSIKFLTYILVLSTLIFTSCKEEEKDEIKPITPVTPTDSIPANYTKVGEAYLIGTSIKAVVYTDGQILSRYTNLYTALYDSATNTRVTEGVLTITPMMDMGTMKHSAPSENTTENASADKFWHSQVVFSMPGEWDLNIYFEKASAGIIGNGSFKFQVTAPTLPLVKSIQLSGADSSKILIALLSPSNPKLGMNDLEITVHKKQSAMLFPPAENYTIEINPQMPSMGHGSPRNENPIHISNGHYKGKVNFTMSGLWRVYLTIKKDGTVVNNNEYFDIEF